MSGDKCIMINFIKAKWRILKELISLPHVKLNLAGSQDFYEVFTARHPKFFIFQRKTLGVALIALKNLSIENYLVSINGKNSAAYYSRKAGKRGYIFQEINPNDHLDDLYTINTSKSYRQGRAMDQAYVKIIDEVKMDSRYKYYGVFNTEKRLVAYAYVPLLGEVATINTILGHGEYLNDGIMYFLVTNILEELLNMDAERRPQYLMYDMWFGASPGLRQFKCKCGFRPYWVRWTIC